MNQSNKDTDDILDAIKSMMSDDQLNSEQNLPKDIIELTKPIDEKEVNESNTGILELTELAVDDVPNETITSEVKDIQISEDQIRNVVRNAIEALPKETIDNIINEELKRVVLDRLGSAKISISSQDNKD
jgi:23S rRNA maturation-related 3'-5' exoribonuclease YhaM|tara:strand:- start:74 stop:463 length:390 start_codon:yes stop_codon:yes gene_type:complete